MRKSFYIRATVATATSTAFGIYLNRFHLSFISTTGKSTRCYYCRCRCRWMQVDEMLARQMEFGQINDSIPCSNSNIRTVIFYTVNFNYRHRKLFSFCIRVCTVHTPAVPQLLIVEKVFRRRGRIVICLACTGVYLVWNIVSATKSQRSGTFVLYSTAISTRFRL